MSKLTGTYEDEIEASLKPCPRCNGKALIENFDEILCDSCGLWSGDDWPSLDEAVEWWNKQPHIEALEQRIAELEAQLANQYERIDGFVQLVRELETKLAERWEPVNELALDDGRTVVADNIALTVAEGNTAMDTLVWPENGYEYNLCRRVREGDGQ